MTLHVQTHLGAREDALGHLDYWEDWEVGRYDRARHLAELIHDGQFRGTGDLYVTHVYGVAKILVNNGFEHDLTIRICALLHDVIEDCSDEARLRLRHDIEERFGLAVYVIIEALTREKSVDYSEQLNRAIRLNSSLGLWRIPFIKLADILFNLSTIEGFNNYRREMKQYKKAEHLLTETLFPARPFIPQEHLGKYDELLANVATLLPEKRQETIERRRAIQHLDESYFPSI